MARPPKCKLCGHAHWLGEPHVFDGPAKPLAVVEDEAPVSVTEAARLETLESMIAPRLQDWLVVGEALAEIKSARLYRGDFATFERYLDERWHLSRRRGYQLIDGADNVHQVHKLAPELPAPASERVARELAPLRDDPEEQEAAWRETVEQHGSLATPAQTAATVAQHGATRETVATPELAPGVARKAAGSSAPSPAPPPDRIAMAVSAAAAALLHLDGLLADDPERAEWARDDLQARLRSLQIISAPTWLMR